MSKKLIVYAGMGLVMILGIAATGKPEEQKKWKNLKIMPKNTDEEQMDRIMYQFTKSLGVTCSHCHPDTKPEIFPRRVDFVTDELAEKQTARDMMRMTDKLNRKYFNYKNDYSFESLSKVVITCKTCHRGLTKPSNIRLYFNQN